MILSLSTSLRDMRERLGRIVVGYTYEGQPVTAEELKAAGAMAVMLREAIKPNLLQTLEHTPVFVHAGPFGNIATGNSSVVADLLGIHTGDFLITEAGFGADMGAERFFDVKCRVSGLQPDAALLVVTVRALKTHSGRYKVVAGQPLPPEMLEENVEDVRAGAVNLRSHIEIVRRFGVSPVVAINAFPTDHPAEHEAIREIAEEMGVGSRCRRTSPRAAAGRPSSRAGRGGVRGGARRSRTSTSSISRSTRRSHGRDARSTAPTASTSRPAAAEALRRFRSSATATFPVVIAKTHLSISSDPTLRGAPTGWRMPVREVRAAVGAGYVYAISGEMRTMPGLGAHPAAERIDIDEDGEIVGLS